MTNASTKDRPIVFVSGGEGRGGVLALVKELALAVARIVDCPVYYLGVVTKPLYDVALPDNFLADTLNLNPLEADSHQHIITFLDWIKLKKPAALIVNDVSQLDDAWQYIPDDVALIGVLHDEGRKYRAPFHRYVDYLDRAIVVAKYMVELLVKDNDLLWNKVTSVHNGIFFPLNPTRDFARNENIIQILYMGGIDLFRKGVQDIPKLAHELNKLKLRYRLVIVGGENNKLRNKLRNSDVDWKGYLPREECMKVAQECDFFFLPSRVESFGLALVEAMSMGCVPIAYDIESGPREIIKDGINGILVPLADTAAAAKRIAMLYNNSKEFLRVRQAAIDRARNSFSLVTCAEKYAQVIRDVISNPSHSCRKEYEPNSFEKDITPPSRWGRTFLRSAAREIVSRYPQLVQPFWRRFA